MRADLVAELQDMAGDGYLYLGSPYSKYPDGIKDAARYACQIAGKLLVERVPVFSPIAHSHVVSLASNLSPFDHELWMWADRPMMDAAHGLIVVMMRSWMHSRGLTEEIRIFHSAGKPIFHLDPAEVGIDA